MNLNKKVNPLVSYSKDFEHGVLGEIYSNDITTLDEFEAPTFFEYRGSAIMKVRGQVGRIQDALYR